MYDPKVRLTLLIITMVILIGGGHALYTYLAGSGLNIESYASGIASVGGSIAGGFLFVWVCTAFITFRRLSKSGFEATFIDETGTEFNFPVSLSKFLPEIVAAPYAPNMHPVEAELLGFINGFKDWPYDLEGPNNDTLYEHSLKQYRAMSSLPDVGYMHRIASLAQDLSKTYAYIEKRKVHPYWQFWKRDDVKFIRKCDDHCGMSVLVLSTMPSFRHHLGKTAEESVIYRRAILTAMRYRDNPTSIPANCHPLAKEIYECIHRANQKSLLMESGDGKFEPTGDQLVQLHREIHSYFQSSVKDSHINPADISGNSEGVYVSHGRIILSMPKFMKRISNVLSPTTRGHFRLWDIDMNKHLSWPYTLDILRNLNVLLDSYEDIQSNSGLFNLRVSGVDFPHAIIINIDAENFPELRKYLDTLPEWTGLIEMQKDRENLLDEVKRKANTIDTMLKHAYDEVIGV